jgi:DNA-binding LacI/PurR family transcriptional regulator
VIVDNELGAHAAVEHLFSLGHRQIALIRGPKHITDTAPRWKGVRTFAKAHDLQIDPDLVLDLPESSNPDQCSVIGFDDIAHSSVLTPALTTVRQHVCSRSCPSASPLAAPRGNILQKNAT